VYFSLAFVRVRSGFTVLAYPAIDRSAKVYSGGTPLLRDITNESNINSKPNPPMAPSPPEGSVADAFFGASPVVASALGIRSGATPCGRTNFAGDPVSIHTPARGGDPGARNVFDRFFRFQSTPPRGGRPAMSVSSSSGRRHARLIEKRAERPCVSLLAVCLAGTCVNRRRTLFVL